MIRTLAVTADGLIVRDIPLERLHDADVKWYWVDFDSPDEQETSLLDSFFHFHPLAIEDCMHFLQRPKLDHYDDAHFFVLHTLNQETLLADEVDLFVGPNFVVSFHLRPLQEMEEVWKKISAQKSIAQKDHIFIVYLIMDKLVDYYFPSLMRIEDDLLQLETNPDGQLIGERMNEVYELRAKLGKLRRTVFPMRDLLYRVIYTEKIQGLKGHIEYFTDIHDHLLKLADMIESNREMSSDLRDSYMSINANRMNAIMKTLTVITTIFMPLTFIAGIYGMNFAHMPELEWPGGYPLVLFVMLLIGAGMFIWFYRKGWFK
ncbi:magnesium/cobalt transporter CorA [Paenibacillus sp. MBLB4367]|uniref:magnesium/cobalt transporter CorA n=1 Tax=Paenibacillus sp. MBLB4367 TaxID=3384767 RepID=UPI003907E97F